MRRRIISKTDNTVLMPPSSNRIKYTTSDNNIINISRISENENIISNTYVEDFGGVIELDGVLTDMYPGLFSNKVTLTEVTLPNTLHYIAYAGFENCHGLEEVIISNNIIDIYKQAFDSCINLKKIHIGKSVERLGYEAESEFLNEYTVFSHCPNITEITVDPTNITYGDGSDSGGANVILDKNTKTILVGCKNSIIPTSAFIIGCYAFYGCTGMVSITIPSNILEIKDRAFYECSDLKTIIFESTTPAAIPTGSIQEIFNDKLEKILVPHESVDLYKESWPGYASKIFSNALIINYTTSDGNIITPAKTNAFGDAQIVSNTYSNGVGIIELDKPCTVLKDSAFMDITTLTSFKIPESVTSIEKSIFFNTGIEEIYIPKNVTTLGENVLRNMYSLKKIVVDPRNTVFDSRDNCNAIIKTSTNTLLSCCIETVIPESVKIIGVRAYQGFQVENFTIPNWITKLENYAFGWCDKLKSITIPNSVTSIGERAFWSCTGLASIEIPNSVKSIRSSAFEGCTGLKEVHINDLSAWCGINFGSYNANPLYYAKNLYLNGELLTELVIPDGVTSISCAFNGCSGLTSIEFPDSVTTIGDYAFSGCTGLTSIEIPNSVTNIGDNAFDGCKGLKSVTIPNSVTSIGSSAFYRCTGLTSATIPNRVTSIGDRVFLGCSGLTSIEIPNSVTSIGGWAFYETGLTSITIPNSVTSIENYAFFQCSGLTSVVIGNSVTSIGDYAFEGCSSLTSVVIGNSVTSIGNYTFRNCIRITSIEIGNSVTNIGYDAFNNCTGLTSLIIKAITPPTIKNNTFGNVNKSIPVYVPSGSVDTYKSAQYWSEFTNIQLVEV